MSKHSSGTRSAALTCYGRCHAYSNSCTNHVVRRGSGIFNRRFKIVTGGIGGTLLLRCMSFLSEDIQRGRYLLFEKVVDVDSVKRLTDQEYRDVNRAIA